MKRIPHHFQWFHSLKRSKTEQNKKRYFHQTNGSMSQASPKTFTWVLLSQFKLQFYLAGGDVSERLLLKSLLKKNIKIWILFTIKKNRIWRTKKIIVSGLVLVKGSLLSLLVLTTRFYTQIIHSQNILNFNILKCGSSSICFTPPHRVSLVRALRLNFEKKNGSIISMFIL